jgi:UDPglucose 6-dehydrogenase
VTSAKSAELIKHASNAFLALKISFINAVANVCEAVDADIEEVARGIGADSRIGSRFLRAGIGYGGSCFPKDVAAFRSVARECGYEFPMLDEIVRVNEDQRKRFLKKVRTALWTLRGKRLAVLGLAYKGGTDDIRESPAIEIVLSLLREQCAVVAYDPAATARARAVLMGDISYAGSPYEAATGADALIILTDWEEFGALDLARIKELLRYPIVVDGRNLYSRDSMQKSGFLYVSMGRPAAELEKHSSSGLKLNARSES